MTGDSMIAFMLFWGIWLLVPILFDGTAAFAGMVGVWIAEWQKHRSGWLNDDLNVYPRISIVIPVYNGAASLGKTIESLRKQTFPPKQIEVIVVDNGSNDETERIYRQQQMLNTLGALHWISIPAKGKPWALNAGIHVATGEFIANVDADVELHPSALTNMVKAFRADPKLAAATGSVEIAPDDGQEKSPLRYMLQECEFVEYLMAFRVGRQFQTVANSIFTLAGAFSFFRREVLLNLRQYTNRTVSEDTDITFALREKFPDAAIACIADAVAYSEPSPSLASVYSQRVRWQRGELEVAACNPEALTKNLFKTSGPSPVRTLIVDHTLAFPRVVWTFVLPMMWLFGYALPLVVSATLLMYLCYMVVEGMTMLTCYLLVRGETRERVKKHWWLVAVLPAYRFMLFWFRLGGFLTVLNEPAEWKTQAPWEQASDHVALLKQRAWQIAVRTSVRMGSGVAWIKALF